MIDLDAIELAAAEKLKCIKEERERAATAESVAAANLQLVRDYKVMKQKVEQTFGSAEEAPKPEPPPAPESSVSESKAAPAPKSKKRFRGSDKASRRLFQAELLHFLHTTVDTANCQVYPDRCFVPHRELARHFNVNKNTVTTILARHSLKAGETKRNKAGLILFIYHGLVPSESDSKKMIMRFEKSYGSFVPPAPKKREAPRPTQSVYNKEFKLPHDPTTSPMTSPFPMGEAASSVYGHN